MPPISNPATALGEVIQPLLFLYWLKGQIPTRDGMSGTFRIPPSWLGCYLEHAAPHLTPLLSYFPMTTRTGHIFFLPEWLLPPAVPTNDYMHSAQGLYDLLKKAG